MLRASASGTVDSGVILNLVRSMTVKLIFIAFVLDGQCGMARVENKPESLLVVLLGKDLSRITPILEW